MKALDRATAMALHKKQEAFYLGNRSSLAYCWNWAHGEAGATIDEIVEQFDISREQITSGITFGRYRRKRVSYL